MLPLAVSSPHEAHGSRSDDPIDISTSDPMAVAQHWPADGAASRWRRGGWSIAGAIMLASSMPGSGGTASAGGQVVRRLDWQDEVRGPGPGDDHRGRPTSVGCLDRQPVDRHRVWVT